MKFKMLIASTAAAAMMAGSAMAAGMAVKSSDQDVSSGTVTADSVMTEANGWMVVHRVKPDGKPGPVVGHAPLREGENTDVVALLTEPVKSGEQLMLMIHGEEGGSKTGVFEYSLGAKEDGPVKVDGKLVMQIVTAQ